MRSIIYIAVSAFAAFAVADDPEGGSDNPFNVPKGGYEFNAGHPTTLTWDPTTDGTVTLKLQIPGQISPESGIVLGANIPNSGSFSFVPPTSLNGDDDYTVEIIDDDDKDNYNFTPSFSVDGTTGTATELKGSATDAPTATVSSSASTATDAEDTTSAGTTDTASTAVSGSSTAVTTGTGTATGTATGTGTETGTATSGAQSSATTSGKSTATTSGEASEETGGAPDPDSGAMSLTIPGGMLSGVLAMMALL